MALSNTEKSLCNKLYDDYLSVISPVKMAKGSAIQKKNALKNALASLGWSPLEKVGEGLQRIKNAAYIPSAVESAMWDIRNFLRKCDYAKTLSPANAALGAFQSALRSVEQAVRSQSTDVPEFSAASIANKLDSMLKGIPGGQNLADLLRKADQILECLSAVCAVADPTYNGRVAGIANDMDALFRDMYLIDNPNSAYHGTFDYEKLYNEVGLTPQQRLNFETARNGIMNIQQDIIKAKDETMQAIQFYTKMGFFS